ncbi:TonB-dependent receptor [Xenophilus arseniciresistens]|uniref:TonB-dependent receptor n=2 Tax=Xenophilus arseniciresistens TaxID=1283306 RepID=A0AAE3T099_9BURK|nr:TonB-dependent receptor [Xenophilus arseniciresistens]MDA7417380.1 TonB-dependent receptor [Xenophilus arseniciresistens]
MGAQAQTAALPTIEVSDSSEQLSTGRLPLDRPAETGSRLGLTPRENPASVSIVERATIEASGARNTQEALQAIAGVTAHDAPGNVGVQYRGFGSGSLSQLFNGIHVQYSIAARPVDSWIYERVEAIGGPSSFLNGAGAVGGTLNYITRLATRSNASEAQLRLGSERLREASVGLNRRIAGDGNGSGDHHLRIDVNHRRGGAWTEGTRPEATQLATSLLSDLGGGLSHTLAYEYQKEEVQRPYWGTPLLNPMQGSLRIAPATREKNYNSADGLYAQRVQWLRSITEWRVNEALSLRNTAYSYDALRDYRNVESYRFNAGNTAVTRSASLLQRHDQRLLGNRFDGTWRSEIAGRRSDWAFGIDLSLNRQTRFPNSLPGTVSTVNPYLFTTEAFFSIPGMRPGLRPDRENRVRTTAVFAENRTQLTPSLALVTALRHERIALDLNNRREVNAANPAHYARSYRPTTGRLGLVWDFAPGANLYAQYATAADPPAGILTTATFAQVQGNSELSTGRQIELGSKWDFWRGKGTATAAAYRIVRKNIATQDPANSSLTVQVGEQSSRGVELAVGLQATAAWAFQANASWVDAQYENFRQGGVSLAGRTPTNTPRTVLNVWSSYAITPQLQASAGIRRVGAVYADAANTQRWSAYTLLDLGLSYQFNRHTTLTARVRNATDRVYALNVGGTQAYLGAPRTADVALRLNF